MPDIEYNTFHPAAAEDNEEGTLLPPSLSGTTTSASGEEEVETKIATVLSPSKKKIGFGVLFVGLTIVAATISKNNAGNRTSVTKLPTLGSCDNPMKCNCCVAERGTIVAERGTIQGYDSFEICWQAYEGDLSDNKPINPPQYCSTKAYTLGYYNWEACKPTGSWKFVEGVSGDCGDPCEELDQC